MLGSLPLIRVPEDRLADLLADPGWARPADAAGIQCVHRQTVWELVMAGAGAALLSEEIATTRLSGVALRAASPEGQAGLLAYADDARARLRGARGRYSTTVNARET